MFASHHHRGGVRRSRVIHRRTRLSVWPLEERTVPATFTVGNTQDSGVGSLRQAVLDANALGGADTIVFDSTVFANPQTITLTSGEIAVSDALTITGPGPDKLTVSGNQTSRVFNISQSAAAVSISDLTVTDGKIANGTSVGGAGIFGNAALTLQDCIFTDNQSDAPGGAVYVATTTASQNGNLIVQHCQFLDNGAQFGGGIAVLNYVGGTTTRTVTIADSLFSGGVTTLDGAGLAIDGKTTANVTDSSFFDNQAFVGNGYGGAIAIGTLASLGGTALTISNCTLNDNTAGTGGAIYSDAGYSAPDNLTIQNSTIVQNSAANGGGIYAVQGTVISSVVSGNSATQGPDIYSSPVGAKSIAIGHSAIGQSSGFQINDLGGNLPFGADLKLGLFRNYGGQGPGFLPASNSPLVDAGSNPAGLSTDERGTGFPRQIGGATDIGALEANGQTPVAESADFVPITIAGATIQTITVLYFDGTGINLGTVGTGNLTVAGPNGFDVNPTLLSTSGPPTALTAVYAFTPPGGSWIGADDGGYSVTLSDGQVFNQGSIPVGGGDLGSIRVLIPRTLVVTTDADSGSGSLRAELAEADRIAPSHDTITFDPSFFATPRTITLASGEFSVTDSLTIQGPGAGLLTVSGAGATRVFDFIGTPGSPFDVTISGLTVSGGSAEGGGGVYFAGRDLTIADSVFVNNQGAGGAIDAFGIWTGASLEVTDTDVIGNQSSLSGYNGGGISADIQTVSISGCQFAENSSDGYGGGLFIDADAATIEDCSFAHNSALDGGGIASNVYSNGSLLVRNVTISDNQATYDGGGLYSPNGNTTLLNSTITANTVGSIGGGAKLSNASSGPSMLESVILSGNSAPTGPDVAAASNVSAKNCALGTSAGYTLTDLGGNLPIGADLHLSPLADNGGPTLTCALLPGSPCIDAGSNPSSATFDQRGPGYNRQSGAGVDIGAFEVQNAPQVASVVINSGASQRSRVTSVAVNFNTLVTLPANPSAAFQLVRISDNKDVDLTAAVSGSAETTVTLTFAGALSDFGSLQDGRYTLTVLAGSVSGTGGILDGNGDGIAGDDYVLASSGTSGIFRLFGDADGSGTIDAGDFLAFRLAFLQQNATFDFDNSGSVDANDFLQFRLRFLEAI